MELLSRLLEMDKNSLFQLDKEIRGLEEEIQEQDQLLGKSRTEAQAGTGVKG